MYKAYKTHLCETDGKLRFREQLRHVGRNRIIASMGEECTSSRIEARFKLVNQ